MPQRMFQQSWFIPGTLAASHTINFKPHHNVQLIGVSMSNASANAGSLKIGTQADDDAYLTATSFGVSSVPVEVKTPAGFAGVSAGGQFPHIDAGTNVLITITDHASHMAGAAVLLTFTEG